MNGKVVKDTSEPTSGRSRPRKRIVIKGPPNSEVKAIFPGKVVFSGSLKGYGELIIINHGSRFFTVSAHLSERTKIEGDVVKEGEIVGRVDGNVVSGGGRLFFEIRQAGKRLSPQEWLKVQ